MKEKHHDSHPISKFVNYIHPSKSIYVEMLNLMLFVYINTIFF